jgi:hypothetical protein
MFVPVSVHMRDYVDLRRNGELRSKTAKMWLSQQGDDGFACVRLCRIPYEDLFGVTGAILRARSSAKTPEMARPRHNSGSDSRNIVDRHDSEMESAN